MKNVITNDKVPLLNYLQESFARATQIKIIVSFILESGVRLLLPDLQKAVERNVPVQILTGRYLNITEPSALYLLRDELSNQADIRIFESSNVAFHPKTYIFLGGDQGEVYVGSSNMSRSALVDGIEWNYRLLSQREPEDVRDFIENFDHLFSKAHLIDDEWLKEYSLAWKRPRWLGRTPQPVDDVDRPQPLGAQIEALHYLKQTREEGFDRGMVVMATGVGKTYLAAFDSAQFRRVLFVAHREEILRQAWDTFVRWYRPRAKVGLTPRPRTQIPTLLLLPYRLCHKNSTFLLRISHQTISITSLSMNSTMLLPRATKGLSTTSSRAFS